MCIWYSEPFYICMIIQNKEGEKMYGVIYIFQVPYDDTPILKNLELFSSFKEALHRSETLIDEFKNEYGEYYIQHANEEDMVAIMSNGDVVAYAFIKKIIENK